ncbi:hypothetical protein GCM10017668_33450 [Streptomyces tuirus]|uniref:Uncharacterized protein n=1 Tax=Streptomyces tuirus TaxID=68278 RepID=A0A7G1NGZ2_9ACTN|nr:hypothetical protein GCM10017668_33450 [Streptomyces tuirus]
MAEPPSGSPRGREHDTDRDRAPLGLEPPVRHGPGPNGPHSRDQRERHSRTPSEPPEHWPYDPQAPRDAGPRERTARPGPQDLWPSDPHGPEPSAQSHREPDTGMGRVGVSRGRRDERRGHGGE